jgi:hypothetical protein
LSLYRLPTVFLYLWFFHGTLSPWRVWDGWGDGAFAIDLELCRRLRGLFACEAHKKEV